MELVDCILTMVDWGNVPLWVVASTATATLIMVWRGGILGRDNKPFLAIDQRLVLYRHNGTIDLCVDAIITNISKVAVDFNEVQYGVSENNKDACFTSRCLPVSLSPGEKFTSQEWHKNVSEGMLVSYVRVPEQKPRLKIDEPTYWQDARFIEATKPDAKE